MTSIPILSGVISKDDVLSKGAGSFSAAYVSWARIANHLHANAPGWEFALRTAPDGGHVWKAPDGTGYVVSYFKGPENQTTPDFVYPCQDHRNMPILFEKVSCRTLTDTHRRALCANAAFSFSLGYELWAKQEIEDTDGADSVAPAPTPAQPQKKPAPKAAAKPAAKEPDLISEDDLAALCLLIMECEADYRAKFCKAFAVKFKTGNKKVNYIHLHHYPRERQGFRLH